MGIFAKISNGLAKSRNKFKDGMYDLIGRGPNLDEEFWEGLEETLILSDIGGQTAYRIVDNLRSESKRLNLKDSYSVLDLLSDEIVDAFSKGGEEIFGPSRQVILFVGINGTGKTTTVGKIAKSQTDQGRKVILGSADTFRAAAIEQLEVWSERAGVEMVTRERGSDPASVCFETVDRADEIGSDLVLIDTAGRLHTSDDLMRELVKVVNVTRKRAEKSGIDVYTVLVIDATTGQNGMQQAREFDKALDVDGLIVTKLDGTAKGGIALAISSELDIPILKIGVGEGIDDLRDFDAREYVAALIGDFDEEDLIEDDSALSEGNVSEDAGQNEEGPSSESLIGCNVADIDICAEAPVAKVLDDETLAVPDNAPGSAANAQENVANEASGIHGKVRDEAVDEKADTVDTVVEAPEGSVSQTGDLTDSKSMSWDEFVAFDDELKAKKPKKRHFWDNW